jgi:hypothetical protein
VADLGWQLVVDAKRRMGIGRDQGLVGVSEAAMGMIGKVLNRLSAKGDELSGC